MSRRRVPTPLRMAAGVAVGAVVALLVLDRVAARLLRPRRRPVDTGPEDLAVRLEPMAVESAGHLLRGWIHRPEVDRGGAVAVLVHGWSAHAGTLLALARGVAAGGHPVVLFDVRGHGRSPGVGRASTEEFRDDVAAVLEDASRRFSGRPVVAVGHSLGGAAAILAVREGAPAAAVATISAPAEILESWATYANERGLPGPLIVRALVPFWRRQLRTPLDRLVPEAAVNEIPCPLLVVQGDADRRVPPPHGPRLAARGRGVELVTVEGAGHADILERAETVRAVRAFLDGVT